MFTAHMFSAKLYKHRTTQQINFLNTVTTLENTHLACKCESMLKYMKKEEDEYRKWADYDAQGSEFFV